MPTEILNHQGSAMAYHPDVEALLARGQELGEHLAQLQATLLSDFRMRLLAPHEPNPHPHIDG